jgi:hypothetical protein
MVNLKHEPLYPNFQGSPAEFRPAVSWKCGERRRVDLADVATRSEAPGEEARGFSPRSVPAGDRTTLTGAETWLVPAGRPFGSSSAIRIWQQRRYHVHALRDLVITLWYSRSGPECTPWRCHFLPGNWKTRSAVHPFLPTHHFNEQPLVSL